MASSLMSYGAARRLTSHYGKLEKFGAVAASRKESAIGAGAGFLAAGGMGYLRSVYGDENFKLGPLPIEMGVGAVLLGLALAYQDKGTTMAKKTGLSIAEGAGSGLLAAAAFHTARENGKSWWG